MKPIAILAAAASLALLPSAVLAQATGEAGPNASVVPTPAARNKPLVQGAKESATEAGQAIRKSGSDIAKGVKEGASAVGQGVKKGVTAVERKVAVAECKDGSLSYTKTKTCSDHGGIAKALP